MILRQRADVVIDITGPCIDNRPSGNAMRGALIVGKFTVDNKLEATVTEQVLSPPLTSPLASRVPSKDRHSNPTGVRSMISISLVHPKSPVFAIKVRFPVDGRSGAYLKAHTISPVELSRAFMKLVTTASDGGLAARFGEEPVD